MSAYFCFICKHFTGVEKNPFHCDKCGICRYVITARSRYSVITIFKLFLVCPTLDVDSVRTQNLPSRLKKHRLYSEGTWDRLRQIQFLFVVAVSFVEALVDGLKNRHCVVDNYLKLQSSG